VRLAPLAENGVLGLAEGIETGLSVMQACPDLPVWAALAAGNLAQVILPPEVARIVILADHDREGAGIRAAERAAARHHAEGRRVWIAMPERAGEDFNDLLQRTSAGAVRTAVEAAVEWTPSEETQPALPEQASIKVGGHRPVGFSAPTAPTTRLRADDGDLARLTERASSLLKDSNTPPWLYRCAGRPSWVERDDEGRPIAHAMIEDRLRHALALLADWRKLSRGGDIVPAHPPKDLVKNLLATPDPALPVLAAIVTAPVFGKDGSLVTDRVFAIGEITVRVEALGTRQRAQRWRLAVEKEGPDRRSPRSPGSSDGNQTPDARSPRSPGRVNVRQRSLPRSLEFSLLDQSLCERGEHSERFFNACARATAHVHIRARERSGKSSRRSPRSLRPAKSRPWSGERAGERGPTRSLLPDAAFSAGPRWRRADRPTLRFTTRLQRAGGGGSPASSPPPPWPRQPRSRKETVMAHATLPKNPAPGNRIQLPAARHGANAGIACPAAVPPVPAANDAGQASIGAILALDLGTVTGWALHDEEGAVTNGTASFRPDRFEGGGMSFLRFKRWLAEVRNATGGIDAVYLEEVRRHAGTSAAQIYGGWLAQVTAWCEHHGIPYQGVPVGTIKRHVTGKSNASKQAVIEAVRARGFIPADDNEADPLALLLWAIETGGAR